MRHVFILPVLLSLFTTASDDPSLEQGWIRNRFDSLTGTEPVSQPESQQSSEDIPRNGWRFITNEVAINYGGLMAASGPSLLKRAFLRLIRPHGSVIRQGEFVTFRPEGFVEAKDPGSLLCRHYYEVTQLRHYLGPMVELGVTARPVTGNWLWLRSLVSIHCRTF